MWKQGPRFLSGINGIVWALKWCGTLLGRSVYAALVLAVELVA
jgi:hypothetical protein